MNSVDNFVKKTPLEAVEAVSDQRLWNKMMEMAQFGATSVGGVNRAAFSSEDIEARNLLISWAHELDFKVSTDAIGNIFVRRSGKILNAPPVLTGSHLDSQPKGGKFDGAYGVIGGFEALEAIERTGLETKFPIEVVAWSNEEGGRFQPGAMGSAVFSGDYPLSKALGSVDRDGENLGSALQQTLSATPGLQKRNIPFDIRGYIEAHIEQGPILENGNHTIGVVSGVQGLCWYKVEVFGEEAHAGTAPLKNRKDALKTAVHIIESLEEHMADDTDTVRFTIGRFECSPGAPSTVPGKVLFTIDFRHPEHDIFKEKGDLIPEICKASAGKCRVEVDRITYTEPVAFDCNVMDLVRSSANALGLSNIDMVSGAGHDAMHIAPLCPAGMIFVPCEKGISHNESENASPGDLADGVRVLVSSLVALAEPEYG